MLYSLSNLFESKKLKQHINSRIPESTHELKEKRKGAVLIMCYQSQWFQSSILVVDIAAAILNRPRGRFSENHLKCRTGWEGRDGVTITSYFSIQGVKTRPALHKKTPPVRFEMN